MFAARGLLIAHFGEAGAYHGMRYGLLAEVGDRHAPRAAASGKPAV
jgi:hypothetical protein